jgi:hypothetical protein
MCSYHPYPDASWAKTTKGVFELDQDYYQKSGGILTLPKHYLNMFERHQ